MTTDDWEQTGEHLPRVQPHKIMAAEKKIRRFFRGPNSEERGVLLDRLAAAVDSAGDKDLLFSAKETIQLAFLLPELCKKDARLLETVLPLLDGFWGNSWLEAAKAYVVFYQPKYAFYSEATGKLTLAKCLLEDYIREKKEDGENSPEPPYIQILRGGPKWLADVLVQEGVDQALSAMGLGEKGWLDAKTLENSGMYQMAIQSCFEGHSTIARQCAVFERLVEKEASREDLSHRKRLHNFLNQWVSFYAGNDILQELDYILTFLSSVRIKTKESMQQYLMLSDETQQTVDQAMELETGPRLQKREELLQKLQDAANLSLDQRATLFSEHDAKLLAFLIPEICQKNPALLDILLPYIHYFGGSSWREAVKAYIIFYIPSPPFFSSKKTDTTLAAKLLDFCNQHGESHKTPKIQPSQNLLRFGARTLSSMITQKGIIKAIEDMGLLRQGWLRWNEMESSGLYQEAIKCYYKNSFMRYDQREKIFIRLIELMTTYDDPNQWAKLREILDYWMETQATAKNIEEIKSIKGFLNTKKSEVKEELREYLTPSPNVSALVDEVLAEDARNTQRVSGRPRAPHSNYINHSEGEHFGSKVPQSLQDATQVLPPKKGIWGQLMLLMNQVKRFLGF